MGDSQGLETDVSCITIITTIIIVILFPIIILEEIVKNLMQSKLTEQTLLCVYIYYTGLCC